MLFPFGEYRPDVSDLRAQTTRTLANVLPRADGYGPFPGFADLTSALAAACKGLFFARKSDGTVAIFAATSSKLYKLDNTDYSWDDVSKALGTYSAVPANEYWQFAQFNNFVFAVQANTAPQVFNLASSTEFVDLGGSPPQARYVSVVNRFLVLSGHLSNPFRIQWSGLNATTTWTPGTSQSDFQDLPDGGIVRGVGGGESGIVFQDGAIRRMTYAPGSPVIFQIDRVTRDIGLYAPLSLVISNDKTLFLSSQGFYAMSEFGGAPVPIGKERFDRTFLADYDAANPVMIGAADPKASRVFWAYKSVAPGTTSGLFDKIVGYDIALNRWIPPISVAGEYLSAISQPGVTLEGLDSVSGSIDALTQSLDSFASSAVPEIAAVSSSHKVGLFRGANLEASLVTAEQAAEDQSRIFVRAIRPVADTPAAFASIAVRETQQAASVYGVESELNRIGECPQRVSTRYARARLRIPAGTNWTYVSGVEADIAAEGYQ
jgi:hypothetical protein